MKKSVLKILLIYILFLPLVVKAETDKLQVSCSPGSVSPGGTTTCSLSVTPATPISSMELSYSINNSKVTLTSFNANSDKIGLLSSPTREANIDFTTVDDLVPSDGTVLIGTFVLTFASDVSGSSATITFSTNKTGDDTLNEKDASLLAPDVAASIAITGGGSQTETNGLKSLTATGGVLSPAFSSSNKGYTLYLDSASTTTFGLSATPNNSSDTVTFTNAGTQETISNPSSITFATSGGNSSMNINIKVGDVTYTVLVTKPSGTAASNELSRLTVGGVTVPLSSGNYNYTIELIDINDYTVDATLKDSDNYKIENLTLPTKMSGETEFVIIVSPKSNSSGLSSVTYTIKVRKGGSGGGATPGNNSNPNTGKPAIAMAIVLILSFGISIYLYRKNLETYN